jgi:hypothetical protein
MRLRHNKKRNTAFVYEALVRELTKCIVKNNASKRAQVISIIKEFFTPGSILAKELQLYKPLYSENDMPKETASKLIAESKLAYSNFDKKQIFNAQTKMINKINKTLGASLYDNFIPNYKSIASVYSIFNVDTSPKNKVLLEEKVLDSLTKETILEQEVEQTDELVYKTFINKFNEKYSEGLHEEQSRLLNHYITSMEGSSLELKIYLNEELGRIKGKLKNSLQSGFADGNVVLKEKTEKVLQLAEGFREVEIDDYVVENLLKMQQLIREVDNAIAS